MAPYDFYINGGMNLETRQARAAGLQLHQDLNHLMSDVSINIKRDNIIQANKDVLQLQQNLNAAMNPSKGTIDLAMLQTQLGKTGASLTNYAGSLAKYGKEGQQAFLSLTKSIAAAEAPTTRLSQGLKNAGEQLKRTIGWQLSSSAIHGVMSTYSQAIGYAKELNRSLTDIRIVTGQSQAQMANFAKYANVAAKNLSSTTTRYTDAALIYYQQGLSEKAVKDRTDVTIKMANVAGVSAEKASQQLTAIWNNFDNGSKSLEHYADVLVKLGSETASSSDEISKGVQKFAAIGNTVGLSYEYAASALATVTATTRESADTVGTSFRTLFSRLQGLSLGQTLEDGTTLNKYSKALNTIGVRIKETNGDMKAMDTILDEIGAKWKTLSKDTQIGLAQSVGGARQYASFMALMDNWDYFQENVDRANSASGSLQKQQEIYAEGWQAASNRVRSSMEGIFDSVIDDKGIIKMTNAFAGALDIVNGLSNGLGGLDGILGSVGGLMLSRYGKELPRVLDDLKYNIAYAFNPKQINDQQDQLFKDSINSINYFRQEAGLTQTENGWVSKDGKNIALATEFNNLEEQVKRRQEYLRVEKTLSQREKEEYQQRMLQAEMWDNQVLSYAKQTQESYNNLNIIRESVAEESFANIRNIRDNRNKTFKGQRYDFTNDARVQAYEEARRQAIQDEYNRRNRVIDQRVGPASKDNEIRQLNDWRRQQLKNLSSEVSDFKIKTQTDYETFESNLRNSTKYYETAFSGQEKDGSQITVKQFQDAMRSFNATGQVDYGQRQILAKGFSLIQEPIVEAGKALGNLDGVTSRLVKNLNTENTTILNSIELQKKNQTGIKDGTFTQELTTSWNNFVASAKKNQVDTTTGDFKTAETAYQTLKTALEKGTVNIGGQEVKVSESKIAELTKQFQASYNAAIGQVDRKAWESGLTPDQTQDIIAKAKAAGISEDAQKDIEYRRQQEQFARIEHQATNLEILAKAGTSALMAASTIQAGSNLYKTMTDEKSTGTQKVTSALGTFASTTMLSSSLLNLAGTASKAGGLIGTIGSFASAHPYVLIATAIGTALAPMLTSWYDDTHENEEEKQERIGQEISLVEEDKNLAVQKATNFETITNNYLNNLEKAKLSEKGTSEFTENAIKSNEAAYSLIDSYELKLDEDYTRNEDGIIEINPRTLNDVQKSLDDEAIAAQNRSRTTKFITDLQNTQDNFDQAKEEFLEADTKYRRRVTWEALVGGTRDKNHQLIESEELIGLRAQRNEAKEDYYNLKEQIPEQQKNYYADLLSGIASSDGLLTESENYAVNYLQSGFNQKEQQKVIDRIEAEYGGDEYAYTLAERKEKAQQIFDEDRYNQIINSEEYKLLETEAEKNQYLARLTKYEALVQEYDWQIKQAEKTVGKISSDYKNISSTSLKTLNELISEETTDQNKALGQNYAAAQYNKAINDLQKAITEYTDQNAETADLNQLLIDKNFTLGETTVLAETMQQFGDTFGEDAAKSIFDATINASEKDRRVLLDNLKEIDFSGSNINTLNQMYDLSEDLGEKFTEVFEDVKKSFGGDAGIFKEIVNDKSIQKLMSKFEQLGDIDAESIVKATHSSADLAMAMEMAGFNAGGLAAALEGVASGTIKEEQVTNSLLAGLSVLNQVDSIRAEAYDSIDTYDKGRSVTEYGKFTGNLAKTIQYNLRNGYMFDETLQNAWGELFGEDRVYELQQDFINWQSGDKKDISKAFNEKYKDEKEFLEAIQKNPYDLSAQWKYAFKKSDVDVDEHYNDVWVDSDDTEKDKDTDHVSYNTVGEEEYRNAWNILYNKEYQLNRDLNGDSIGALETAAAEKVIAQAKKEQAIKNKYVNINGAIYEVGGENGVTWDENTKKWVGADGKSAPNVDNALFGWNSRTKQVSFNEGFMESDMTLDDMRDYIAIGMGMGEDSANRMIADLMAQNTTMQKKFGDSQADKAIDEMTKVALENDEWITQDQMDVLFQSSNYLKNKYEAGETEGWMADYLNGKDVSQVDITKYQDENGKWKDDKAEENYKKAQAAYEAEMAQRADFQKRYISFGKTDLRTATFEEADAALTKATGMGTIDRLQSTKVKLSGDLRTVDGRKEARMIEQGQELLDIEKNGYDMSDTMQQLLAMGYSQTQAYEAMGQIMKDGNSVLIETVRDVDGNVQTFSSDSKAYQQWATQHGIEDSEQNAEAFSNFISEQDAVAKAVQQMAVEAQARAQYEAMYDEKGNRKTDKDGNPIQPEDKAEGDAEEVEEGLGEQQGEDKPTTTEPEIPVQAPASSSDSSSSSSSSSSGTKGNGILNDSEYNRLSAYGKKDENGNWGIDWDAYNKMGGEDGTGYTPESIQQAADKINKDNKNKELDQYRAVGQNQDKIKKHYAQGRKRTEPYEGLAVVGEKGPELSIDKDGNATMLGVHGQTYAYVEKDDIIFTADETKDILKTTPNLDNIPGFEWGIGGSNNIESSAYGDDNIWSGYKGSSGGSSGDGSEDDDWEPDRYVTILEQLQDLQREYARLVKAKERAFGADKIKALDAEIAKTNELISAQKQYIKEISAYKEKDIAKLKELGVTDLQFDKNGVIRNFEEVQEKYKKAAEEGDETAAKQYEAIMKYMETNNLLEEQQDALIDMQWQLLDARIERITTKVDIKVAVDDTDLQYLSYQLGKIQEEAYDVAKALNIIGDSIEVNLNKINAYRQGLSETLQEAFTEIGLTEEQQSALLDKIEQGTLTQEDLDNFEISPDHSANIMNVLLDYRQQLITVNQQLDQLRDQVTDLVVRHFTDFTKDVGEQTSLINTYTSTLQTYANLTELLNGRFQGNMDKMLTDINASISKNAKDSIKNTELLVQAAEVKYKELNNMYLAAQEIGDQDTMEKVADARDKAYKELQEANNKYASAWMSANEAFLNEFKFGVNQAIENFQEQLSPLFGTVDQLSAAFERQNGLNDQYVDDYEKYYELNKMNRDLQTAIDETDNINTKKALAKLQEEINKEKESENKLSEYDLDVLKNKIALEKARLALDEAKNAKSTVTLSRDQNGNWGYIYTAEEDKVAKAEQEYEDKLYEYQKANKEYLDDLQAMVVEAQSNMVSALAELDVNDPHYEEQRKSIIDSYMQTIAYVKEQMTSALGNQEDSRLVALERYDISMINLKNDFEDLSLSFVTGEKNLENYFATLETSMPKLLAQLNELENKYEANIADINNYVTGNKNIADYMNENMDTLVNKSEEANQKIQGLYDTMVDELADVNKEVADIYNNWLPHIMEMTEKNEILAESISKIQHELSDLSEVEVPPVLQGDSWEHPEGYTENDYGVIRKLTEDEIKLREEIAKEIKKDDKGVITNYDELKEKWYEEAPAEGEEDTRDADKKAKWELLQKLIGYGAYGDPTAKQTIGLTGVWETIQSNAAAMYKAAETIAEGFKGSTLMVEQTVHINADFSGVTDRNEIQEAFNNLINEAAQYAYRRS